MRRALIQGQDFHGHSARLDRQPPVQGLSLRTIFS